MAEEFLDVVDEQGNKTGVSMSSAQVHRLGLLHRSAHVWIVNSKGEILLQLRSAKKWNYGNMWDTSVAGHISSGESSLEAAHKEVGEELGLQFPDSAYELLFSIKTDPIHHRDDYIDHEFHDVYLVRSDAAVEDMHLQQEEVESVKWVPLGEFKQLVADKNKDIVPHAEYPQLFAALDEKLGR